MAPDILPTHTRERASLSRSRWRSISMTYPEILKPKVVGIANCPWVLPIMTVSRCLAARAQSVMMNVSRSLSMMSRAALNSRAAAVSTMSLEVAPRWT